MDVISKEGPLFLQGVKFGKVRLFTENDHFTLNSIGHFYVFLFGILFNSSTSTAI